MVNSSFGIPSRLAFFVCGVISVLMGNLYRNLTGAPGPVAHGRWDVFSVALTVVGGFAAAVALLPSSWVERVCKTGLDNRRLSSIPIKMLGGFAVFSYLLAVGLYFVPPSWHPSPWLVFSVCPACVLAVTVEPSLGTFLLLLATLNAAVYGSLGAAFGFLLVVLRRLTLAPDS